MFSYRAEAIALSGKQAVGEIMLEGVSLHRSLRAGYPCQVQGLVTGERA